MNPEEFVIMPEAKEPESIAVDWTPPPGTRYSWDCGWPTGAMASAEVLSPEPTIFDGHRWDAEFQIIRADMIPYIHLAYKARRGDEVAKELLTAFRVTIQDAEGKQYWPMLEGK